MGIPFEAWALQLVGQLKTFIMSDDKNRGQEPNKNTDATQQPKTGGQQPNESKETGKPEQDQERKA